MRIGIVGSRNFKDYQKLIATFDFFFDCSGKTEIVSGEEPNGADSLAKRLAQERGYAYVGFPPVEGATFGQKCFNRNRQIVDYAEAILAFWDGRIQNCGTLITMQLAVNSNKRLYCIGVRNV